MAALHFNGKNKQEFLDECANLFKGRYTDEDSTFMNYMNKPSIEPPVLEAHASHQSGHRDRRRDDSHRQNDGHRRDNSRHHHGGYQHSRDDRHHSRDDRRHHHDHSQNRHHPYNR